MEKVGGIELYSACEKLCEFLAKQEYLEECGTLHIERFVLELENGETPAMALAVAKRVYEDGENEM